MEITKTTARKLYKESPSWFKKELVEYFGEKELKEWHYTDIKTIKDACERLNKGIPIRREYETPDEFAYRVLKIVIEAINEDWKPDWGDSNQRKWWPYFNLSSGFGFSYSTFGYAVTAAGVGSRLCFESEEKSTYAGKQFIDLYKQFLT